tara:strand:- start:986 stop:1909 length:924 start_codon:yes stop_codon:yes gene_type:complete
MSKGGGGSQPTTQVTSNDPDPQVKAAYLTNLDYARDVSNQLGAQQFADFNPQYQAGEQQIMNAAQGGVGMQNLDTAADLTRAAAGYTPQQVGYNQSMVDQYMNPYTDQVINTSVADLERSRQGAVQQMGQRATAANAFGGSRQGVAEALTNQEYGTQAGSMIANLRNQGFNSAVQNAMNAQQLNQSAGLQGAQFRLGAANQLGTQGQQQTGQQYAGGQAMMGLGGARQGQAQAQLDADRTLGMQRLGIMQGALGLQPANLGGVSTMTGNSPSYQNTGANVMGGAMAGNALFAGNPYAMAGGALLGLL